MAVPSLELHFENYTDIFPLLMDQPGTNDDRHHVIDIPTRGVASSASPTSLEPSQNNERPSSSSTIAPVSSENAIPSANSLNTRNPTITRRRDGRGRRSPLNSGIWISTELLLTLSQIVASIVVLSLSRHEHPRSHLRAWIVGYACGCFAILPLLYWRFCHRNVGVEQVLTQAGQVPFPGNLPAGVGPSFSLSVTSNSAEENVNATRNSQISGRLRASSRRIKALVWYFKIVLDCFFAVWFVVGNVWIFGGQASASNAPNLYRLCIVFLTFSCIKYAMPFILCATICCCLPCMISILGFREDMRQTRGATTESINALPTYKFKAKKNRLNNDRDTSSVAGEGEGVIAAGTDKEERSILGEDPVCCICLAKYSNNEELRELPCSHFFHKDCVDKWLKINASCPLCKAEVGESIAGSLCGSTPAQEQSEVRVVNSVVQLINLQLIINLHEPTR